MLNQAVSEDTLAEKYARDDERTALAVQQRVARTLANAEANAAHWEKVFLWAQQNGVVMGGRINAVAGTGLKATLLSSFVQPIGDSVLEPAADGKPSIMQAQREAAETLIHGGGVGYDFSSLRPAGALIRSTGSAASGPIAYMQLFDGMCKTVRSISSRRGAQMGILRIDHPDIEDFIHAKDRRGQLSDFNISVAVTDAFMEALATDGRFQLVHDAEPHPDLIAAGAKLRADGRWVYRELRARDLWEQIMRSTYDHAEPGVVFIDRINQSNNLYYCEQIDATNPCAEQVLPAYGCACLGSLNLTHFVRNPFSQDASFDFAGLQQLASVAVRMLDNVLTVSDWPLPQQRQEALAKRRVGLGFLGLGNALTMLGVRYDSVEGRAIAGSISSHLAQAAYAASVDLAKERGPFPLFDTERYLEAEFVKRLPAALRDGIRQHGIRNSHLLSIAPTGTISLAFADNASSGIEPTFGWGYTRLKRNADGSQREYRVEDHAYRRYREAGGDTDRLPAAFVTATAISAQDHLDMVAAVAPFVDSAISKTVNIPVDYSYADFKNLYWDAWCEGVKSLATYRPNEITGSILLTDQPKAVAEPTANVVSIAA